MIAPIFALLNGNTAVANMVGTRIYRHGRAPEKVARPYITWSTVGGHDEDYIADAATIGQGLLQIDLWSNAEAECLDLLNAVLAVLEPNGYKQGKPEDMYEEDTELYRWMFRFYMWTNR